MELGASVLEGLSTHPAVKQHPTDSLEHLVVETSCSLHLLSHLRWAQTPLAPTPTIFSTKVGQEPERGLNLFNSPASPNSGFGTPVAWGITGAHPESVDHRVVEA